MQFEKRSNVDTEIPSASLPDIVFMLLIFFMVSTVLKESEGLQVTLPDAQKITKLEGKRGVATIWADRAGTISIDDNYVQVGQIQDVIYNKITQGIEENVPIKVISLRVDRDVEMGRVSAIHEELREVGGAALNINYSSTLAAE